MRQHDKPKIKKVICALTSYKNSMFFNCFESHLCVFSLDPLSSGSYQRSSGRSDQSHPAAAVGPSVQTQRNTALHLRGVKRIKYSACAPQCSQCTKQVLSPSHQDYVAAMEDFQQSLELKKNQPIAMLYKGLTFFHRGMLKVRLCVCVWVKNTCSTNTFTYLYLL